LYLLRGRADGAPGDGSARNLNLVYLIGNSILEVEIQDR
jgi:hypothetical protein